MHSLITHSHTQHNQQLIKITPSNHTFSVYIHQSSCQSSITIPIHTQPYIISINMCSSTTHTSSSNHSTIHSLNIHISCNHAYTFCSQPQPTSCKHPSIIHYCVPSIHHMPVHEPLHPSTIQFSKYHSTLNQPSQSLNLLTSMYHQPSSTH